MKGEGYTYEGYVQPQVSFRVNNLDVVALGKDHIKFDNTGSEIYMNFPTYEIKVYFIIKFLYSTRMLLWVRLGVSSAARCSSGMRSISYSAN